MDAEYPTAADCREIAEQYYYLRQRNQADPDGDPYARDRYTELAKRMVRLSVLLEANPHYFTEQHSLRAA
jgi:hypothetical protein